MVKSEFLTYDRSIPTQISGVPTENNSIHVLSLWIARRYPARWKVTRLSPRLISGVDTIACFRQFSAPPVSVHGTQCGFGLN